MYDSNSVLLNYNILKYIFKLPYEMQTMSQYAQYLNVFNLLALELD